MAKKKAPAKKKQPAKKNASKNASVKKPAVVVVIIVTVLAIIFYGLKETGEFAGKPIKTNRTEKNSESSNSNSKTNKKQTNNQGLSAEEGKVEEIESNEDLPVYSTSEENYYTNSFDFAWPAYTADDAIVEHQFYTLSYSEKHEQANWIAYTLTADNLNNAQFKRKDNFKADPDVSTKSATPADYKKSGYDRGHLAPAADFTWTEEGLDESFFMSNMSPQHPSFNRGIWKKLEEKVRDWAKDNDRLYIVTGPVIEKKADRIGKNKVSVPQYYYKAILDMEGPELKAIGFLMKNEKSSKNVMSFSMSIDELEEFTSLDFFPLLPDELEGRLERNLNANLWK